MRNVWKVRGKILNKIEIIRNKQIQILGKREEVTHQEKGAKKIVKSCKQAIKEGKNGKLLGM